MACRSSIPTCALRRAWSWQHPYSPWACALKRRPWWIGANLSGRPNTYWGERLLLRAFRSAWGRTCVRQAAVEKMCLTVLGDEADVLSSFEAGADDYLTKPFSPKILGARVRAILKRMGVETAEDGDFIEVGGLRIDLRGRQVEVAGSRVELTALEFDLLHALAQHPGWVYSRQQLLEEVWGYEYLGESRVVDVHVANLRKKMADDIGQPTYIRTVRGVGYKLQAPEK